ncbi:MAG: D-alanine--D-alanine ligase [Anaerolineales bacterium]|nr:D-alanine--D-alanine ligase [Anaerolineales bacterium]
MKDKVRLAVIFGGRSGEHEVSLLSARSVLDALDQRKYDITEIGITKEGRWLSGPDALHAFETGRLDDLVPVAFLPEPGLAVLYERRQDQLAPLTDVDVVFPVLHGTFGEDGTLQGLLEMADMPYVGAGVLASAVTMDKGLFKALMVGSRIPVVPGITINSSELRQDLDGVLDRIEALGAYPFFTKPANLGSSVGISKCTNRSDLLEGLLEAAGYDRRIVIEIGVNAREIEVSVMGNDQPEASVPGEVIPGDEFYTYAAKYLDDTSLLKIPADIDEITASEIRRWAVEAYKAVDGAGLSRADFLLDADTGRVYLNEINAIPGFTKISMYPKLWEASGVDYAELLSRLIDYAFERHEQKSGLIRTYGAEA